MIVDYIPEALIDLNGIWDWNAQEYGNAHADAYIEFLRRETDPSDSPQRSMHRLRGETPLG